MKQVTSTLTALLLCLYVSAQVGSLETTTFNSPNGYVINNLSAGQDDYGNSMAVQPADGKIVVAVVTTQNVFKIVRYMPDGTLDPNFGTNGTGGIVSRSITGTDGCRSYAVGIQSTGKIIVGGFNWGPASSNNDFALARFNTDGTLDGTFGSATTPGSVTVSVSTGGTTIQYEDIIRSLVVRPDNTIIVAGTCYNGGDLDFAVAKFSADGVLDGTFGTGGITRTNVNNNDLVNGVAVNSTGSIYVVGSSNADGTNGNYTLLRYTSGGTLNQTITSGISGNDEGYGIAIQSDDMVLITGKKPASSSSTSDLFLARYKTDGTLDGLFGTSGIVTTNFGPGASTSNDEGWAIGLQGNGEIVVAGTTDGNSSYDFLVARYSSTGVLDGSFGPLANGMSSPVFSAQIDQANAIKLFGTHIYVAGSANYATSGTENFALASFNNNFNVLPLTLSQFYAQKQTSKVVLQWQTSTEENVKQFVIERSNDGKTYKAIGTVNATGNSATTKNYSFADQSPYMSTNNYYRLMMQDVDGNYKYSKILIIKFDGQLTSNVQVFPNPVKDLLQVQLPDGLNGTIGVQIIDMQGRVIKKNNVASDGNALNTTLDVSSLTSGVYILKAQAGNTTVIGRFTKN
jgi:uncharacterized delta-60 repeat protein